MTSRKAFTLIELLVVIAIIAILAVVVVLTLNPAQLLAQSRDANRVSDMATLQSALNLYTTDQSGNLSLGNVSSTYISVPDPNASSTCGSLGLPSLSTSTGQSWACSSATNYRLATSTGWVGTVNFNLISAGSPFGSVPVDPINQTSTGLFYAYNTNGSQFQVTADLESTKYKAQYGSNANTTMFPEVISGGAPGISALYNPTGLVGYWNFDEGSGSSTIDASGNGNTGTWNGSTTSGSYYAGGIVGNYTGEFNGVNDYVSVSSSQTFGTNSITFCAWTNLANFTGNAVIFDWRNSSNNSGVALNGGSGNSLDWWVNNGSWKEQTTIGWITSTWTFITVVYDGSNLRTYRNGVQIGTPTSLTGNINQPSSPQLRIGYSSVSGSYYVSGLIDDVRVYDRALSPAEVMALYNAEQ